jgi:hypothetical protein
MGAQSIILDSRSRSEFDLFEHFGNQIPMYMYYYMYDVTNGDDILNGVQRDHCGHL